MVENLLKNYLHTLSNDAIPWKLISKLWALNCFSFFGRKGSQARWKPSGKCQWCKKLQKVEHETPNDHGRSCVLTIKQNSVYRKRLLHQHLIVRWMGWFLYRKSLSMALVTIEKKGKKHLFSFWEERLSGKPQNLWNFNQ